MTVTDRHRRAMLYAESAQNLKAQGMPLLAETYFGAAYYDEIVAANATPVEPSRGILYRSAATLACEAGLFAEALKAADTGLGGAVTDEIAGELQEVRERALRELG